MLRQGHENVHFFFGNEIEHTPMHGEKTLFVVGLQSVEDIEKTLDSSRPNIRHIYFGANHSYNPVTGEDYNLWDIMIKHFLDQKYCCTLDMDVRHIENFLDSGLTEYNDFVPIISVKIPYADQLGYNAIIKIDDKDFDATNPGVWCHKLRSLQTESTFTPWRDYSKDIICETEKSLEKDST